MAWHDTWTQMKQKPKAAKKTAKKSPKHKKGTRHGLADRRR